jgi:hypothetical protein
MVPYLEYIDGRPLTADPEQHHQHTFDHHSFDFLLAEGRARKVESQVLSCPGAWGWTRRQRLLQRGRNAIRRIVGRAVVGEPLQILYEIVKGAPVDGEVIDGASTSIVSR